MVVCLFLHYSFVPKIVIGRLTEGQEGGGEGEGKGVKFQILEKTPQVHLIIREWSKKHTPPLSILIISVVPPQLQLGTKE